MAGRLGTAGLRIRWRRQIGDALPLAALVGLTVWCIVLEPAVWSVNGMTILFQPAIPLVLAAVAQMFIIMLGDIDLGTGFFVGFVNAVVARYLTSSWLLVVGLLVAMVVGYALSGALVQLRKIPAIIVTLGASFIWLGFGLVVMPVPGGTSPQWLQSFMNWQPAQFPAPLLFSIVIALVVWVITFRLSIGSAFRGAGVNPEALVRYGWSMLKLRMICYSLAAFFGILSGFALTGITASGDPNASAQYTLLAIAAVILGGGAFAGGRAVPFGVVIGALSMSLIGTLLALQNVASSYQAGAQGLVLIIVLAGRAVTRRLEE
jgi:ribose transport system permease protein